MMDDVAALSVFDHAPAYLEHDDEGREVVVYRASSLGRCIGAMVRARLGVTQSPPPPKFQVLYDEGHTFEERIIHAALGIDYVLLDQWELEDYGTTVVDEASGRVQVETEIRWGGGMAKGGGATGVKVIRCHPDAIAREVPEGTHVGPQHIAVEAKFFGPDLFYGTIAGIAREEAAGRNGALGLGRAYAVQVAVEMHSTGLPLLWAMGLKVRKQEMDGTQGEVELGEVYTAVFEEPPYTLAELKAIVVEAEQWVKQAEDGGDWPPCPLPLDYPCGYWDTHEVDAGLEPLDDAVLAQLVDAYKMAVEEKDYADEAVKIAKQNVWDRLKEIAGEGGKGKINGMQLYPVEPTQGNVSWAKAYKALAKEAGSEVAGRVDLEEYRGKKGNTYLVVKGDGDGR